MTGSCALEATTNKGFFPAQLLQALANYPAVTRYWIGYSGGLDSHVLLHAMATLRMSLPGTEVRAVHVDHRLQSASTQWSYHCATVCATLQIPCHSLSIDAHPKPGESPEAAARDARYRAIADLIEAGDCLLTAHHQDDQAETLLLQLLRGAGPHGLASMPACATFGKGLHVRPLLGFSQSDLQAYAKEQDLLWIDDQSNRNTDFDRNYLRHEILPRLRTRWPATTRTLSRSASHAAQAAHLLDALAHIDLQANREFINEAGEEGANSNAKTTTQLDILSVSHLKTLDEARQCNVLRTWFQQLALPPLNAVHLKHILSDVIQAPCDRMPCVRWPGAEVRRYRDRVYAMPPLPTQDANLCLVWDLQQTLILPDGRRLSATPVQGNGIKADLCRASTITVRFRQGGERCKVSGSQHTHALKKLCQERGIPPWERARMPLIYVDDQLAAIGDVYVCQPFGAGFQEAGLRINLEMI